MSKIEFSNAACQAIEEYNKANEVVDSTLDCYDNVFGSKQNGETGGNIPDPTKIIYGDEKYDVPEGSAMRGFKTIDLSSINNLDELITFFEENNFSKKYLVQNFDVIFEKIEEYKDDIISRQECIKIFYNIFGQENIKNNISDNQFKKYLSLIFSILEGKEKEISNELKIKLQEIDNFGDLIRLFEGEEYNSGIKKTNFNMIIDKIIEIKNSDNFKKIKDAYEYIGSNFIFINYIDQIFSKKDKKILSKKQKETLKIISMISI